ncbi:hypothetical protein RB195_012727 [Necator americanus]|uniref:Uncharacterized protein n=3 Tax=Necator americanus TaxID=51031 RepID=A0ABR1DS96_NECAM
MFPVISSGMLVRLVRTYGALEASAHTGLPGELATDLKELLDDTVGIPTTIQIRMASVFTCILLSVLTVSQAQVAVNGPFFGRYYAAAKPMLTPGFAQVGVPMVAAAPAPVFSAPVPAPAPVLAAPVAAPVYSAPVMAAPVRPVFAAPAVAPVAMAAPVARPFVAAAPPAIMASPALAPVPSVAVPPPAPVMAAPAYAPAPVMAAPAYAPAPVMAAPAYAPAPVVAAAPFAAPVIPAYAPFIRTPYFIGSNKSKN